MVTRQRRRRVGFAPLQPGAHPNAQMPASIEIRAFRASAPRQFPHPRIRYLRLARALDFACLKILTCRAEPARSMTKNA